MKEEQLKSLVRNIVREMITELVNLSTSDMKQMMDDPSMDTSVAPEDAQTPAEKSRMERQAKMDKLKQLKQKQAELDSKKKEVEFNKKKLDQEKRFDIPNLNKDIQSLKGAQI